MAGLTPRHLQLIDLLADLDDARPRTEKASSLGFAGNYVYELLKKPEFLQRLHARTSEFLGAGRSEVLRSVKNRAVAGSTRDAELYLKASGDIGSGTNVVTNITQTNEASGRGFADRLKDEFEDRILAAKRDRIIQEDEG